MPAVIINVVIDSSLKFALKAGQHGQTDVRTSEYSLPTAQSVSYRNQSDTAQFQYSCKFSSKIMQENQIFDTFRAYTILARIDESSENLQIVSYGVMKLQINVFRHFIHMQQSYSRKALMANKNKTPCTSLRRKRRREIKKNSIKYSVKILMAQIICII